MAATVQVLGIDIGGTGIKAGCVDTNRGVIMGDTKYRPTPQPPQPEDTVAAVREVIRAFDWHGPVGIGYPGVVKDRRAWSAANLTPEWIGKDLFALFGAVVPEKIGVLNDADAAGLAEMRFGAGADHANTEGGLVLLCTFGTGIGTALFYRGVLIPNTEFGHIEIDGRDAEKAAAASARTREGLTWEEWGRRADRYLREMEKLISFDVCIIGGGISENFESFRPFLNLRAEIRAAHLRNDAGIIGAALAAAAV